MLVGGRTALQQEVWIRRKAQCTDCLRCLIQAQEARGAARFLGLLCVWDLGGTRLDLPPPRRRHLPAPFSTDFMPEIKSSGGLMPRGGGLPGKGWFL